MRVYIGIDLHANNLYVSVIDIKGKVHLDCKLPTDLGTVLGTLSRYKKGAAGVVVESTYNWYWLVDGLMDAGYPVHLANPAGNHQYSGKKHSDDRSDARWLAELLRLGILVEGTILPKEDRAVRDLLRKRGQMVRQRTANILSVQNLYARNIAVRPNSGKVKGLSRQNAREAMGDPLLAQAVESTLAVMAAQSAEIKRIEGMVLAAVSPRPEYELLKGAPGIGVILALTILLEAGDIGRFPGPGHFASYCRCVGSEKLSNGKKKGEGNGKCGNRYLAWAFAEAAHHAIRSYKAVHAFYERKRAKRNGIVGLQAVAHKLARASYHMLHDKVAFDMKRAFT